MYETDIGACIQNFPDGQKCQSLARTIKEGFLGATALWAFLETAPSSICGNVWPRWILDSGTWGPGKAPKPFGKEEFTLWEIKRKILDTFCLKIIWQEHEVPQVPAHLPHPSATFLFYPSSIWVNLAKGKIKGNQKQPIKKWRYESS